MEPELGPSGYRPPAALLGRWLELLQRLVVCPLRAALWFSIRCLRLEIREQIDIATPHLEKAPDREASALGLEAESKEVASHSARRGPRANRHASLHARLQSERQHILRKRGGEAGVAALKHGAAHRAHGRTLVANKQLLCDCVAGSHSAEAHVRDCHRALVALQLVATLCKLLCSGSSAAGFEADRVGASEIEQTMLPEVVFRIRRPNPCHGLRLPCLPCAKLLGERTSGRASRAEVRVVGHALPEELRCFFHDA